VRLYLPLEKILTDSLLFKPEQPDIHLAKIRIILERGEAAAYSTLPGIALQNRHNMHA